MKKRSFPSRPSTSRALPLVEAELGKAGLQRPTCSATDSRPSEGYAMSKIRTRASPCPGQIPWSRPAWARSGGPEVMEVGKEAGQTMIKRELSRNDDGEWKMVKNGQRNSRCTPYLYQVWKATAARRLRRRVTIAMSVSSWPGPGSSVTVQRRKIDIHPTMQNRQPKSLELSQIMKSWLSKFLISQIMMGSLISPDEKIARRKSYSPKNGAFRNRKKISSYTVRLSYLRATWQETCIELEEECQLQWQPNVVYFTL